MREYSSNTAASDMTESKKSLLSLGSNMGNPKKNIQLAVQKIADLDGVQALRESRYRKSMPVGGPSGQAKFVNAAIEVSTTLDPQELLSAILKIEQELGRKRKQRWDERIIDIDILTWDQVVQSSPNLTLPHPRMPLRRFVLEPVCDLVPLDRHPETGWTYARHLEHLAHAGNYVVTLYNTNQSAAKAYLRLSQNDNVLVAQSLPLARSVTELGRVFGRLKHWISQYEQDVFLLCDFAPRECLIQHPELAAEVATQESSLPLPRLLVFLTDNIHNESRHQFISRIMPDEIIAPWLFLDINDTDRLHQELEALASCHL